MVAKANQTIPTTLIFTYGTLKRGFWNHTLLQDLMRTGDASFVGSYRTKESFPLVCGPYRVPFLINSPGSGYRVEGEVYAVTDRGLARTDELEGLNNGHYVRLPIDVVDANGGGVGGVVVAEAYYAHPSYAMELWRKEGKKKDGGGVINSYSEKEAKGYVKRKDRPQHLSFLDHIRIFLSSSD
ncbi:putative gamma-glutamylcyclotransferase At3g02910 [Cucurbita pepo subsp. pepo]|uniref:putative gamma-glutamylcyclotransferase At3g02910 n=1 Tax=Cucurbita pepo subsp. pepo TaxID=3664 RepID=UPI000C9D53AE|nr:putative gamma-glutamylcyclotransferase At3g02910 [Cucurbita pepo subsp. pepo]